MKGWVRKEAVIAVTKSLGVKGWAEKFYRWIPCFIQDGATGKEDIVEIKLENLFKSKFDLTVPTSQLKVMPKHLGLSIRFTDLKEWNRIREASEKEEES